VLRLVDLKVFIALLAISYSFNSMSDIYESIENGRKYKIDIKTGGRDNQIDGFWGTQKISLFVDPVKLAVKGSIGIDAIPGVAEAQLKKIQILLEFPGTGAASAKGSSYCGAVKIDLDPRSLKLTDRSCLGSKLYNGKDRLGGGRGTDYVSANLLLADFKRRVLELATLGLPSGVRDQAKAFIEDRLFQTNLDRQRRLESRELRR